MRPTSTAADARASLGAPTRTRDGGAPAGEAGYAMLEAVVAMAILALLAALCLPRAGGATAGSIALLREAGAAGALLREGRNAARGEGRVVTVEVDLARRTLRSGATGRRLALGASSDIEARFGARRARRGTVAFYPDGRSSGASLDLRAERSGFRISVHPLTSAVTVLPLGPLGETRETRS